VDRHEHAAASPSRHRRDAGGAHSGGEHDAPHERLWNDRQSHYDDRDQAHRGHELDDRAGDELSAKRTRHDDSEDGHGRSERDGAHRDEQRARRRHDDRRQDDPDDRQAANGEDAKGERQLEGYGLQGAHIPAHAAGGRESQADAARAERSRKRRKEEEAARARSAAARKPYRPGRMTEAEREARRRELEGNAAELDARRAAALRDADAADADEARRAASAQVRAQAALCVRSHLHPCCAALAILCASPADVIANLMRLACCAAARHGGVRRKRARAHARGRRHRDARGPGSPPPRAHRELMFSWFQGSGWLGCAAAMR
jgi:hypothetical protein